MNIKMKTISKVLSVVAALSATVALPSCNNEDFLNTTIYDIVDGNAMFENDANAKKGLNAVYEMMQPDEIDGTSYAGDWGFKPNLFTGCHPTVDTQATGWDKDWNSQNWNANSGELSHGWNHAYGAITRANDFLAGLQAEVAKEGDCRLSAPVAKSLEGEGRALRGFFYHWLATTFGRVPMLKTGENYSTDPQKARAESYAEMWDFIIEDFTAAAELLEWTPMSDQYGRCTKGMALAFLGDAYMWKAYRLTDGANGLTTDANEAKECYKKAAAVFDEILTKGPYKLSESFTTNWDPAGTWNKEAIWCEMLDEGTNWAQWGNVTSKMFLKFYTACPENGGWGSLFLSWEWWSCFEQGDKRRAASGYTGAVGQINPNHTELDEVDKAVIAAALLRKDGDGNPAPVVIEPSTLLYNSEYAGWYEPLVWGVNPYLQEAVGKDVLHPAPDSKPEENQTYTRQFHFYNGEYAPSIWSAKLWRTASAAHPNGGWDGNLWSPTPIYWKRLANVYLDYAECLFNLNGGDDSKAWGLIKDLRERAWGNNEVGLKDQLTAKFLPYYNDMCDWTKKKEPGFLGEKLTEYPLPFNEAPVVVPDAKTYYTALKTKKGFESPVWKIAVNEERRKEFNCEWCLRPDMQKSNYMADHVAHNYPKREAKDLTNIPWTNRTYDYNDEKMDMPIPADELVKNPLCDQNSAYLK